MSTVHDSAASADGRRSRWAFRRRFVAAVVGSLIVTCAALDLGVSNAGASGGVAADLGQINAAEREAARDEAGLARQLTADHQQIDRLLKKMAADRAGGSRIAGTDIDRLEDLMNRRAEAVYTADRMVTATDGELDKLVGKLRVPVATASAGPHVTGVAGGQASASDLKQLDALESETTTRLTALNRQVNIADLTIEEALNAIQQEARQAARRRPGRRQGSPARSD